VTVNFNSFSPTHQGNQCINQGGSISNAPEDQAITLVSEIANIAIASTACSQSSSVKPLSKDIAFELPGQSQCQEHQKLCVKALGKDSYLSKEDISTIGLKTPLPEELKEKYKECTTTLDLLGYRFPLLTKSLFKKQTEIPKFVISFLNHESELNPSLQIQTEGRIAFISPSLSAIERPEKHTCNISLRLEEKVTVIGVLIGKQKCDLFDDPFFKSSRRSARSAYNSCGSDSHETKCRCPSELSLKHLSYTVKDREKKVGETLYPFYLEIVSSNKHPI